MPPLSSLVALSLALLSSVPSFFESPLGPPAEAPPLEQALDEDDLYSEDSGGPGSVDAEVDADLDETRREWP